MKYKIILLCIVLSGCAGSQVANTRVATRLSQLDAERYQVISINKFDNTTTSCGEDKLLRCLDVHEATCYKIYRAAAVDCFDRFYAENGTDADVCAPSNKGFIDGCILRNVLKYGKGGIKQTMQCMQST